MEPRPRGETQSENSYTPDEKDKKTLKFVYNLYSKSKQLREPYVEKWKDYYHMFRGKQWKQKRPSYRHSEVVNLVFTTIQNQIPLMTDTRPRSEFIATEPQDIELAKILDEVFTSDWERQDWMYTLTECLYDAHLYGIGLSKIDFNERANFGLGQITWDSLEPIYAYPEAQASDINNHRKCGHFIYAEPIDLDKIEEMYPEKGKYVRSDLQDLWQSAKTDLRDIKYRSPSEGAVIEGHPSDSTTARNQALVITLYCRPGETEENEIVRESEDGKEETLYQTKLKYPRGRKVVIAGNVVLEDEELELEDKSFPIQKVANYIDPRSFYGISDIEQTEGPQIIFNKLISFSLDVLTLMGNPIWIVDRDSDVDTDDLFNIPGAVVEKEPGSEIRRETGVQLQPYVLQLIDRVKLWFDDISGSQEVSRGSNPSGVTAARAIEALQQSGRTRIRQKTRNMDSFLREFGRQYVQYALKNYSVPRIRRITGRDGSEKYFKFHTEKHEIDGDRKTVIIYEQLEHNPQTGQTIPVKKIDRVLTGDFDVRVNTVSGLPFSKAENEQKLLSLFDRGVIDEEELLKGIEYPNAEAVLKRLQEKRALQAQAESQGQQPTPR